MANKNRGGFGGMKTPMTNAAPRPFGIGMSRPGLDTASPMGGRQQFAGGIAAPAAASVSQPIAPQSLAPMGGGPTAETAAAWRGANPGQPSDFGMPAQQGASTARPGEEATVEEYRLAQQGGPQAMALFQARNPGWTPPGSNGGLMDTLQAALTQQAPVNGPGLRFDAGGNLLPGQQFTRFTPPPGW